MFKKKCKKCNSEITKKFKFCTSCGLSTKMYDGKNYGLLVIDDNEEQNNMLPELGTFGGGMLNKMFVSKYKLILPDKEELEEEIRRLL